MGRISSESDVGRRRTQNSVLAERFAIQQPRGRIVLQTERVEITIDKVVAYVQ